VKTTTTASKAGDAAKPAPGTPLIVHSRSRPIVLIGLGGLATAAFMVAIRRTELDFDEAIMSAAVLVLGLWLAAQACGLLLRRSVAGHAMRLDADGLHHPGWGVVPWAAVRGVGFRRLGGDRSLFHLVLDIDPGCPGPSHGTYVRWLFGPIEGLWRRHGRKVEIPLIALDVDPQALVAAAERWRASAGARP
jgi:Arc/MetJ family transcription regulator